MNKFTPTIVIIGGGLAGLHTAWKCSQSEPKSCIILLERSPYLGGRCMSVFDKSSSRWLDNCPHVFLNCCYNIKQFFTQTGLIQYWKPEQEFYFYPPNQTAVKPCRFKESNLLPGLLRLCPALLHLNYLTLSQKWQIISDLLAMQRIASCELRVTRGEIDRANCKNPQNLINKTFSQWLDERHVSESIRKLFYEPVVLSALSCSLDKPSYEMVQKVFVSSFFEKRNNWNCSLPTIPLREMFDVKLANRLESNGVEIRRNCTVSSLNIQENSVSNVILSTGEKIVADHLYLAVNYLSLVKLFSPASCLKSDYQTESISCVHFWTDKPIIPTSHGIFPGRTVQWIFSGGTDKLGYYYRAVISGTNCWQTKKEQFETVIRQELLEINPNVTVKRLKTIHWKHAVHIPSPEWYKALEIKKKNFAFQEHVTLVGDWINPCWPTTMEGAIG